MIAPSSRLGIYKLFPWMDFYTRSPQEMNLENGLTVAAWHCPIVEITDSVGDVELCQIVEMSSRDAARDRGEGYATFNNKKVEMVFYPGDIAHPNTIVFRRRD